MISTLPTPAGMFVDALLVLPLAGDYGSDGLFAGPSTGQFVEFLALEVPRSVPASTAVSVSIGSDLYQVTTLPGQTPEWVAADLAAVINAGALYQATALGRFLSVYVGVVPVQVTAHDPLVLAGSAYEVKASVQPAAGDSTDREPGVERRSGQYEIFVRDCVGIINEVDRKPAPFLIFNGEAYDLEVSGCYQMGALDHLETVAFKRVAGTSEVP